MPKIEKKISAYMYATDFTSFNIHKYHRYYFSLFYRKTQAKSNNFSGTKETVNGS